MQTNMDETNQDKLDLCRQKSIPAMLVHRKDLDSVENRQGNAGASRSSFSSKLNLRAAPVDSPNSASKPISSPGAAKELLHHHGGRRAQRFDSADFFLGSDDGMEVKPAPKGFPWDESLSPKPKSTAPLPLSPLHPKQSPESIKSPNDCPNDGPKCAKVEQSPLNPERIRTNPD